MDNLHYGGPTLRNEMDVVVGQMDDKTTTNVQVAEVTKNPKEAWSLWNGASKCFFMLQQARSENHSFNLILKNVSILPYYQHSLLSQESFLPSGGKCWRDLWARDALADELLLSLPHLYIHMNTHMPVNSFFTSLTLLKEKLKKQRILKCKEEKESAWRQGR